KAEITESEKKMQIVITEIPFQVNKSSLVEQFAKLVVEKKIDGIRDIRDESDKDGMRVVFDLQRDAHPQKILNRLYKFSDLQKTFHLNLLALVDGIQPKVLSLVEILQEFLQHKRHVVTRRTQYDLARAKDREHILEGLHRCLANIDRVIKLIRGANDRDDAKVKLQKAFKLSELQANAILDMRLAQLAKLERAKIEDELKEVREKIKELAGILGSPKKIDKVVIKEFAEAEQAFGDERKTRVQVQGIGEIAEEDLVPQEETIITLTQGGYIKRINPATYKLQKRGGKGIVGMKTVSDDIVEHFLYCNTHDSLMVFTDSGKVFQLPVYEIPEGTRVAKGRGLLNFAEVSSNDKVLNLFALGKKDAEQGIQYMVMTTKNGLIKKTPLEDFKNVRKSGLIAISLKKGDELRRVQKSTGKDQIIITTKKGQSIRFEEKDARSMGRTAAGTRAIRLKKGDEVVGMDVIGEQKKENGKGDADYLLILTENGYGKRTHLKEYRVQSRGGSGIKTANITPKTGNLVYAKALSGEEEDLIVISRQGQVIRTAIADVAKISRSTQGVRIMRLDEGDKVVSAASF
ncbi:MAG: DNA gyrase C-terminal beta-propeller domain-containing protein, partial [bacterium]|nr:DNA gyrase C-terminal beta-propeller domain-containing protein [bacterium]